MRWFFDGTLVWLASCIDIFLLIFQSIETTQIFVQIEHVKQRCLPGGLNLPLLEEYDYHNDSGIPDVAISLLPNVRHRPYQEKSLTKLLGNGAQENAKLSCSYSNCVNA